jgi:hypothetical protein
MLLLLLLVKDKDIEKKVSYRHGFLLPAAPLWPITLSLYYSLYCYLKTILCLITACQTVEHAELQLFPGNNFTIFRIVLYFCGLNMVYWSYFFRPIDVFWR